MLTLWAVLVVAVALVLGIVAGWLACLGFIVAKFVSGTDRQRATLLGAFLKRAPLPARKRVLILLERELKR